MVTVHTSVSLILIIDSIWLHQETVYYTYFI